MTVYRFADTGYLAEKIQINQTITRSEARMRMESDFQVNSNTCSDFGIQITVIGT